MNRKYKIKYLSLKNYTIIILKLCVKPVKKLTLSLGIPLVQGFTLEGQIIYNSNNNMKYIVQHFDFCIM